MKRHPLETEFASFLTAEPVKPPVFLTEQILKKVREDLAPAWWQLLLQLAPLHLVAGTLSLGMCSQFHVGLPWNLGMEHHFMALGESACAALCGAVFLGATGLASAFVLRPARAMAVRRREWVLFLALALLSLFGFLLHGQGLSHGGPLLWIAGGAIGGVSLLEFGWMVRSRIFRPAVSTA